MNREKQLAKNTLIISIGTFLPRLFALISVPILTACLSKAEYGTYDLISILETLFLPIATIQIQTAAFRFLIENRGELNKEKEIVSGVLFFCMIMSLISLTILFFCLVNLSFTVRILICLFFLFNIIMSALQQIARGLNHTVLFTISAVIYSAVNVLLILLCVQFWNMGLNGALAALVAAALVTTVVLFFAGKIYKYFSMSSIKKKIIWKMVGYSWPMVLNSISIWVMNLSDRLVLTTFIGIEATAIYAVANKIPSVFTAVQSTFALAWQENASIASKDKDAGEYYGSVFDSIYNIMIGAMVLLIAATPLLYMLLIKGDYSESYPQIPILLFSIFFSCIFTFLGGIYIALKKTKSVGFTTTIGAVVNILVDLALVNFIGIYAASLSTLISYVVLSGYRVFDLRKYIKVKFRWKKILLLLALIAVMCVFCMIHNVYFDIINCIIAIPVAVILNKKLLSNLFKKIFRRNRLKNKT